VDVVFGGSPCQGFSLIGKRALDDPRNALVSHFMRIVTELKPKYFVLENVKGLTIGKHRQFLEEVIKEFGERGYRILENYQVLNAVNYGVPQSRERLFLMGCRSDLTLPSYPSPITKSPLDRKKHFAHLPNTTTVWEAIADLPEVDNYEELLVKDVCRADYGEPISIYGEVMRGKKIMADDYSYQRFWQTHLLTSSLRTVHSELSKQRFRETIVGQVESVSRFLRLDPDGVCNTLRAGTPSSRGAFTSPRPIHPFQPRCITVREAARLHSFPDWFRFHGTKWHGFRQIGNSVPPLLAQAIGKEVMKALSVQPYRSDEVLEPMNESCLYWKMSEAAEFFGIHPHTIAPRVRQNRFSR
jgi:DNA (cytosine-5)-methyltransferase 1